MSGPVFQTVAAVNFLPKVLALAESLQRVCAGDRLNVLLTDVSSRTREAVAHRFADLLEVQCCDDLDAEGLSQMREYYTIFEFNSACKALALHHQIEQVGAPHCYFIDPDMLALGDFSKVVGRTGAGLVVTPHTFTPYPKDGELPSDYELAVAGQINGGFIYVKNDATGREPLEWLRRQVKYNWFLAPSFGMYCDQHWLGMLPYFFGHRVLVLRDPGINIGYWNLHERPLQLRDGAIHIGGASEETPALLFHFSGFSVPSKGRLTRHSERRFDRDTHAVLHGLIEAYETSVTKFHRRVVDADIEADLRFSTMPFFSRIARAEKLWGVKYAEPLAPEGLFSRLGRKLDKMLGRAW